MSFPSLLTYLLLWPILIPVASADQRGTSVTQVLTPCQALSQAARLSGKLITLRGHVIATDEGGWFDGGKCKHPLVAAGQTWPNLIALHFPRTHELVGHPYSFEFDEESNERLNESWARLSKKYPEKCLIESFTGMFDTWEDWTDSSRARSGTRHLSGFGHLGTAPAQLVVKSAGVVEILPDCK